MHRLILSSMFIMICGAAPVAHADEKPWLTILSYNMGLPLGGTKDFISSFSPIGVGADVRYFLSEAFSLGVTGAWQVFNDETDGVTQLNNGNVAVQGKQLRYINAFPVLGGGQAFLKRGLPGWITPFAGFSAGAYYIEQRIDIGINRATSSNWHFGIAPEAGILFKVASLQPVILFRYHYPFSSGGSGDLPYLNINLGLAWD